MTALSGLLSQFSQTQSSHPGKLSDDLSNLLAGTLSSNSDTLHSTAAELLSSTCSQLLPLLWTVFIGVHVDFSAQIYVQLL